MFHRDGQAPETWIAATGELAAVTAVLMIGASCTTATSSWSKTTTRPQVTDVTPLHTNLPRKRGGIIA